MAIIYFEVKCGILNKVYHLPIAVFSTLYKYNVNTNRKLRHFYDI